MEEEIKKTELKEFKEEFIETPKEEKKSIKWAVASLVTGILSLLSFIMPYFGLPLGIFAIVSNHMQNKIKPNGMGSAGFVCGVLGIIINSITGLIALVVFLAVYGATV